MYDMKMDLVGTLYAEGAVGHILGHRVMGQGEKILG